MNSKVDTQTLKVYDENPSSYADTWLAQPTPQETHDLARKYFRLGGTTADIGCGSGRDVDWLCRQGFPTTGFDASQGLLQEACRRFPSRDFREAVLPELASIANVSFDNVLCETVLMHLPKSSLEPALQSLLRILRPAGTLQLSWRLPDSAGPRSADGRLYTSIDFSEIEAILKQSLASILYSAEVISASSGKTIRQLVVRI